MVHEARSPFYIGSEAAKAVATEVTRVA